MVVDNEVKFNVWSEGDASVGIAGGRATVIMACLPADIQDTKDLLEEAFENIWNDDVKIMTDEELARACATDSETNQ